MYFYTIFLLENKKKNSRDYINKKLVNLRIKIKIYPFYLNNNNSIILFSLKDYGAQNLAYREKEMVLVVVRFLL
jgi:hypothetical protein